MTNELELLTKLSPTVLVVIALNVFAQGWKRIPNLPNWVIPIVLPIVGAAIYPFVGCAVPVPGTEQSAYPWALHALIGAVCGGVAVWGHQVVTQWGNRNGDQK